MKNKEGSVCENTTKNEKLTIYDDVAAARSQSLTQLMQDICSFQTGGPTILGTSVQMIYQGIQEYIDATLYHVNEITIGNIKEALAEPSPEDTVHYLQDWLKQYEERYEVISRDAKPLGENKNEE